MLDEILTYIQRLGISWTKTIFGDKGRIVRARLGDSTVDNYQHIALGQRNPDAGLSVENNFVETILIFLALSGCDLTNVASNTTCSQGWRSKV